MSVVKSIRDLINRTPKDAPLDYSQITESLYIAAWPTKHNRDEIVDLGVALIISTILEGIDKELNEAPLTNVKTRMTDLAFKPLYPFSQLDKGVTAALEALNKGEKVMVFCKAGRHRSASMTACILIGEGHSADEAMDIVSEAREEADFRDNMRDLIRRYETHWLEMNNTDKPQS